MDQDTARVGVRLSPSSQSNLLGSLIYSDRFVNSPTASGDIRTKSQNVQGETEYLFDGDFFNLITGLSIFDVNYFIRSRADGSRAPSSDKFQVNQHTVFAYANFHFPANVIWTLGLSYDNYNQQSSPQFNTAVFDVYPKLGLQWNINSFLGIRLAAFRTIKPPLAANRTIQPTQVAGFNQFFDDENGTDAWRYAAALDATFAENLRGGAEASMRNRSEPFFSLGRSRTNWENRDEYLYRGYIYWTLSEEWAASAEVSFDIFDSKSIASNLPTRVETLSVPLSIRYFNPLGFFGALGCTPIRQYVARPRGSEGTDTFTVIDATIGYRLPQRVGLVGLEVDNLFNTKMKFQDDSFREFTEQKRPSRIVPDRVVIARATLNF